MTEITQRKRMISHSEVDIFNQCEQKHHFQFVDKLQPIERGQGLTRGTIGHLYFENFLKTIKAGGDTQEAKEVGTRAMLATGNTSTSAEVMQWVYPWTDFVWPNLGWKIIEVEYEFEPVHFGNGLYMPGKIDAIIERKDPKYGWCICLVDHKFQYDVTPKHVENLLPQLPKYIGALRTLGIDAKMGMYNYVRTRKLNDVLDRFQQSLVYVSNTRLRQHIIEHLETAKQIDEGVPNPVRTANKINCGNCGFVELCTARLEGQDTKLLEKHDFEPNTYGYSDLEIEA